MKKLMLSLVIVCLFLAGCTQYVYLPIGGNGGNSESNDYYIDDDGKVWELVYSNTSDSFNRTWTGWYYATPETAQEILDRANSGENIYFGPGIYADTYSIRTSKETADVHEWVVESTNTVIGDKVASDELFADKMYQYVRTLEDMEFLADKSAVFTGNFIINNAFTPDDYDAVRQITIAPGKGYGNHIRINGLVFNGFRFEGACTNNAISSTYGHPFINAAYNYRDSEMLDSIDGLEFRNCIFKGETLSSDESVVQRAVLFDGYRDGAYNNIKFVGCTFDTLFQGIYMYHVDGITVEDCTFRNIEHNAVSLQNYQSGTPVYYNTGEIIINDNDFSDVSDAVIGRGGFSSADIHITDNQFMNSGDEEGALVKLGNGGTHQQLSNVSISCSGNVSNGIAMKDFSLSSISDDGIVIDRSGNLEYIN